MTVLEGPVWMVSDRTQIEARRSGRNLWEVTALGLVMDRPRAEAVLELAEMVESVKRRAQQAGLLPEHVGWLLGLVEGRSR